MHLYVNVYDRKDAINRRREGCGGSDLPLAERTREARTRESGRARRAALLYASTARKKSVYLQLLKRKQRSLLRAVPNESLVRSPPATVSLHSDSDLFVFSSQIPSLP
ncbi:hypothetical protein EVAR_65913_1 [Eumeta japonica]|uniref:Uncharacterized protein n=1 Tax=Eumeta variegata TaxID=151549 RepID=A0A4C1SCT4_EUMVA|nr:hypothetical protein EVAR_65913_1 [Eumeta japonica]